MIKLAKITQDQEKELIQNIVNVSKNEDHLPIQQHVGNNPDPFDYPDRYIADQDGYQEMLKELKNNLYSDLLWPCTFEIKRLEKDDPLKILPKEMIRKTEIAKESAK